MKEVDVDALLEKIPQFKGDYLFLNHFDILTDEQAKKIAQFSGKHLYFECWCLKEITDIQAQYLANLKEKLYILISKNSQIIKHKFYLLFREKI